MRKISLFGRELTTKTIAALAVMSVVAIAATYTVTKTISLTVNEPFTTKEITGLGDSETIYPGQVKQFLLHITNDADVEYGITVTLTPQVPESCQNYVSIEYDSVPEQVGDEDNAVEEIDGDNGKFNIGDGEGYIRYNLTVSHSAPAGGCEGITVTYSIERGAPFPTS